ncbi:MAG: NAD(P)/FAD-dependent oxidoreductase, partial [Trinickia sp.]|uniref:NAD(P)/FAD-dependent oxidoreductase n=1 Tax=Trinickia sp. TaxID=2571163 RepID=UPI003F7DCE0D
DDVPYLEHFLSRGAGHGWHLDRAAFDEQLRSEVRSRDIRLHRCAGIESITPSRDGWHVQADGPGAIFAHVIVDAGGRRSPLAARLGVTRRKLDKLIALATYASGPGRLTGLSLVEAFEHGWWYAAPVPDGRVLVTLMTDQDIAVTHGFHRWDSYVRAWSESRLLSSYLMTPAVPAVIHRFAAHSGCLERAAGKGWIAVGDALMGWDPLTSSGISGALSDGLAAAPAIAGMLEDRWDAARTYAERANAVFGRYLTERMQRYGAESRWRRNVFWMRRTTQPQWGAARGRADMGAPD